MPEYKVAQITVEKKDLVIFFLESETSSLNDQERNEKWAKLKECASTDPFYLFLGNALTLGSGINRLKKALSLS